MKAFTVLSVTLAVLASSLAQNDDGRYRPELYGDDGKYRPSADGQYQPSNDGQYKGGVPGGFRAASTSFKTYNDYKNYRTTAGRATFDNINTARPIVVAEPVFAQTLLSPVHVQQAASGRYADTYATVLRDEKDFDVNNYHYLYETTNGINLEETGRIDSDVSGSEVRGFFEFVADNGIKYRVDYTAGADGFRPSGAHLPA